LGAKLRLLVRAALIGLLWSVTFDRGAQAATPQIWFAPIDWFSRQQPATPNGFTKYDDYMSLFAAAPPAVMSRVGVFKIYGQLLVWASDDDLRQIIEGLRREHIALALEIGLLTTTDRCGRNVEGYGGQNAVRLVQRIAALGGELSYVAMDEPAWFGHFFAGANACRDSIAELARDAAANAAAIVKIFPRIQIGDIEPVGPSPQDSWNRDYAEWVDAYRQAAGVPLAFFDIDVNWDKDWLAPAEEAAKTMGDKGVPFGIIYNGNPEAPDDKTWISEAEAHYTAFESAGRAAPDAVIFQSWVAHPSHLLPDTDPGAFTYLVQRYFRPRTQIDLRQVGSAIAGRLMDETGKPSPLARLDITGQADTGRGLTTEALLRGIVPTGARTAVLGLRVNTECNCSGPADLSIGTLHYRESGGGSQSLFFAPGEGAWREVPATAEPASANAPNSTFTATPDQHLMTGTPKFPVTDGAEFRVDGPWRVSPASAGSGYLALMFLDGNGKEIQRSKLPLQPGWVSLGTATTASDGSFAIPPPRLAVDRVRLSYSGSDSLRGTAETLPYLAPH
jgi:hypothetical protein